MEKTKPLHKKITSGTKEWADYNVNCFKGCHNNCRYCYAKVMAKRFGRCTEDTWKDMKVRKDIVNTKFRKYNGRVMFPSTHDIIDNPKVKKICLDIIQNLLEAKNEVLITTKPSYNVIKSIIDRFENYKNQFQFRFTITSRDDRLLSFWEPNAPVFNDRFNSLKFAFENEFKTSVSVEPFLDFEPQILIEKMYQYVTESMWIGPMNYIPRNNIKKEDILRYEEIRKNYEIDNLKKIYNDLKGKPLIRFKDSMAIRLKLPIINRVC